MSQRDRSEKRKKGGLRALSQKKRVYGANDPFIESIMGCLDSMSMLKQTRCFDYEGVTIKLDVNRGSTWDVRLRELLIASVDIGGVEGHLRPFMFLLEKDGWLLKGQTLATPAYLLDQKEMSREELNQWLGSELEKM